jgi:hypothetical protein
MIPGEMVDLRPSREWIELGRDCVVDGASVVAVHAVYPNRHVGWTIAPRKDDTKWGKPKAVAVTDRGLLIPAYVAKDVVLRRLRGETVPLAESPSVLPDESYQRLSALHESLREAVRSQSWPDMPDLSDDAMTILCDVADAIQDIQSGALNETDR